MGKELIIYGTGHSNVPVVDLIENLRKYKISLLVDVRTLPRSRFSPQFNRDSLCSSLSQSGIDYLWFGDRLGGLGENRDYEGAIEWLAKLAKIKKVCVMCSEKDYLKCHRHTMIEPSLKEFNVSIVQI